jgi:putative aldouronate transport system permease protein
MERAKMRTAARSTIRTSNANIVFDVLNWIMLALALLCVAYPLTYILSSSFSSPHAVTGGRVWLWPVEPTFMAYSLVFKYQKIWTGYYNSIIYTVLGTLFGVAGNMLAAYPLARKELHGKRFFSAMMLFTMLFSGGLVPTYLWIKQLGMINTIWVMAIPWAVSPWNIVIMRTYFKSNIPQELYESAELDGCSDIGFMFKILIPLSGAIIAVISLFYAVWIWNSYFNALIYLNEEKMFPLQIILRDILIINQTDGSMIKDIDSFMRKQGLADVLKFALIVVASLPLLIAYPFVQRYFIKGVMIGSLKG